MAFYEEVWESARAGCLNLLRQQGCEPEEAEEIFADAYATVMERVDPIGRGSSEPQMVNLLKVACRRALIDLRRHRGVLKEVAVAELSAAAPGDADRGYELAEISDAIEIGREALLSLPRRDRIVFELRYEKDLSPREIQGLVPGLTPARYRKAIQRANSKVIDAYERISSGERCRELDRAALGKFISGAAAADLAEEVEAHLRHCRACRRSCVELREGLRDVASTLAVAASAGSLGLHGSRALGRLLGPASELISALSQAAQVARERARELILRIPGALPGGGGEGGVGQALGASGVKVGILCAGVATATCAATGVVPGIGLISLASHHAASTRPAPARHSAPPAPTAPREPAPSALSETGTEAQPVLRARRHRPTHSAGPPAGAQRLPASTGEQVGTEFGAEATGAGSPVSPPARAEPPPVRNSPDGGNEEISSGPGTSSSGSAGGAKGEFGL